MLPVQQRVKMICDARHITKRRVELRSALSPGAEGSSHAQAYRIRRRCRGVGPDWDRDMDWRANIDRHRRTGWRG